MKTLCTMTFVLTCVLPGLAAAQDWRREADRIGTARPAGSERCSATGMSQLEDPTIEIVQQKTQGRTMRVKGVIEGVCLSEAGLYQNGRKRKSITVDSVPSFKRFEFDLSVEPGENREIRAYNVRGGRSAAELPDTDTSDDPLGIGVDRPSESDTGDAEEADDDEGTNEF